MHWPCPVEKRQCEPGGRHGAVTTIQRKGCHSSRAFPLDFFLLFKRKMGTWGKNSQTFNYVFYTLKNSRTFSFQSTSEGKQGFLAQWHNQLSHLQRGTKIALGRDVTRTLGNRQGAQGTEQRDGSQATCTVPGWNHCQGCKGLWWNADSKPGIGLGPSILPAPSTMPAGARAGCSKTVVHDSLLTSFREESVVWFGVLFHDRVAFFIILGSDFDSNYLAHSGNSVLS